MLQVEQTFNRTNLEWKRLQLSLFSFFFTPLLIAPIWNGNRAEAYSDASARNLLIAPIWNGNLKGASPVKTSLKAFNRTNLEWKRLVNLRSSVYAALPFNRTNLEWKRNRRDIRRKRRTSF